MIIHWGGLPFIGNNLATIHNMIYQDEIYGPVALDEAFVSLMNAEPIQRLKKISQGGAIIIANRDLDHTRYDHSVSVMLLIKRLNGSLQEQIAGLLHDISHTAFSHLQANHIPFCSSGCLIRSKPKRGSVFRLRQIRHT